MTPKLIIASNNPGKVAEFRDLLSDCGWEVVGPSDLGLSIDVDESGITYHENARLKAEAFSRDAGIAALADDSGLEVDALDGSPGALHHVNGWDGRNNAERIQILLDALNKSADKSRTGRYRAVIVVVLTNGDVVEAEGVCEGVIVDTPAGSNGFGYDPVFFLPERGLTMAQLSPQEKNAISHRSLAVARIREKLKALAQTM